MDLKIKIIEVEYGIFGINGTVNKKDGKEQYFMGMYHAFDGLDKAKWINKFKEEVKKYANNRQFDQYTIIKIPGNTDF